MPSNDFLIDQRLRNRLIEETLSWAQWNAGIHNAGPAEHFESFFDWQVMAEARESSALSEHEAAIANELTASIELAVADFSPSMSIDDLIATGWPERIKPLAIELFDLLMDRGRFFENEIDAEKMRNWPWFDRNPVPGSRHYALAR